MTARHFLLFLAVLASTAATQTATAGTDPERPNIIVIVSDDQGYADVGFNGSKQIPTPNIDRIAKGGTIFSNGYVTYPVCGPSRAGLLTGRYQDRFGFGRNPTIDPTEPSAGLPVEEDQISELLKTVGYTNMAVGKWHMGIREEYHPLNQGYDRWFGFLSGGHRYFPEEYIYDSIEEVDTSWGWYKTRLQHNRERVDIDQYLTDELSDRAVEFVAEEHDGPFFLYLAYNAPHAPLQATEEYLERFQHIKNEKRRTYAAMVSAMDDGIGAVLDKLDERGLTDNTLVFFLSDNGGPEQKNASDNGPLREGKGSLYEGGIRVPFAVRWPARIPANQIYESPIISLDILGTIAAVTGIKTHSDRPLDGVNLLPYLRGENTGVPHDQLFWRKFDKDERAVRQANVKLTMGIKDTGSQLFEVETDIGETSDFARDNKDTVKMLEDAHRQWEAEMIDPAFPGLGTWRLER
ncbi:MAG: sulfatase-like hydrolase/transferase [Gammaproteobacteria bacterium]|nr:sulfatase-like hydrolase/transferase [Gammaproteobacteria bacterium]